jgi:hypothetical protein
MPTSEAKSKKPLGSAKLKLPASSEIDKLKHEIAEEHGNAIESMVDSVRHAANCGSLLIQARDKIDKPFRKWIGEEFEFTYRTAYRYIQIAEAVVDGAIELEGVKSIREAVRLLSAATKDEKKEKDAEEKDERIETFVTHAMKIESWFKKETSKEPLATWDEERRKVCRRQLEGVVSIFEALNF